MAVWILCPLPMLLCAGELVRGYGRYRSLSRLLSLFSELRAVLCTNLLPAEELFGEIALRGISEAEAAVMAESLHEGNDFVYAWNKMLSMLPYLSRKDRLKISRYACVFGDSSPQEQIRLCTVYGDFLRSRCEEEKKKLSEGRKLWLTVGAAGSALVLLLMN